MKLRLKIIPTKRCTINCGFCYWPLKKRTSSPVMTGTELRQIIAEGSGFDDIHFFSGEFEGYASELFLPALQLAEEYGYPEFMTTASGVFLSREDLDRTLEIFKGRFHYRLSIDGAWGHGNWSQEGRHGDVLAKFIDLKNKSDRVRIEINWAHKPNRTNDVIKDAFQKRCEAEGIYFYMSYASDLNSPNPKWGENIVPLEAGLDSEQIDTAMFGHCSLPTPKYGYSIKQVQVGIDGDYYACKRAIPQLRVGRVGSLGPGGLRDAVTKMEERIPRFINLMARGSIAEVAKELRQIGPQPEIDDVLNRPYPRNCGGCNLCSRLRSYFHLLEQ